MSNCCEKCGTPWHEHGTGCVPPVVVQRAPAICPLCGGSGIRDKYGIENAPLPMAAHTHANCHGCNGLGWVR